MASSLPNRFGYQDYAVKKGIKLKRFCLISPPGSGKTRIVVDTLACLDKLPKQPILIVCTGPAVPAWTRQIPEWYRGGLVDIIVVSGQKPANRQGHWEDARIYGGVYIVNNATFLRDIEWIKKVPWAAVCADEYHKYMRRRKSQTYKAFKSLTLHTSCVILMSGSWMRKDPSSTFTSYQIVQPRTFTSYWRFVNTWCQMIEGYFGKEIIGPKNVENFKRLTDQTHVYIPNEVVADQLPEGFRYTTDIRMTAEQQKMYREIRDEMLAFLEDDILIASTSMERWLTMRKLLCCPYIVHSTLGMGAGFEKILDFLDEDSHIAIFVPFRDAVDAYTEALRGMGHKVYKLYGGITHEEQAYIVQQVRKERAIVVGTIQYAEAYDLETIKNTIFCGYIPELDQLEQAEGRTRRAISAHKTVNWQYLKYLGTIDEDALEGLTQDLNNVKKVMTRPKAFIEALKRD